MPADQNTFEKRECLELAIQFVSATKLPIADPIQLAKDIRSFLYSDQTVISEPTSAQSMANAV